MIKFIISSLFCCFIFFGCEDTNPQLVIEAGIDALKAVTLSDRDVKMLAAKASRQADTKNQIAGPENLYGKRLLRLVGNRYDSDGYQFDFKVYLSPRVNAFAMADGTIRIYSGLMDMMTDNELLFVIGHEMGHVVKKHIKKKIMLAYAASSVRKGIASQGNAAGDIARSALGGFVQTLLNAQFSQAEERESDDYGISFLQKNEFDTNAAVSALKKLDRLGKSHSFLSSHPEPAERARRLQTQIDQVKSPEHMEPPSIKKKLMVWFMAFLS